MKVAGLIATKNFTTHDASGKITGVRGQPLPPLYYSTARRLTKNKLARRKRRVKEEKNG